ncbi:MAG TPA: hypothetical protein VJS92_09105 [Candidatus Polarisedimenticolaceae bacterium]|nr:hypothetical protein [Candidatus Polarisedimenticolaceae bacterium]
MNPLWIRQVAAILRLELRKNLFGMRAFPVWLLAGLPLFVVLLMFVVFRVTAPPDTLSSDAGVELFFAVVYQFILRSVLYLGCVWIFMNLFRGEVLDRSLHFYFLSPVRREVLVAGKFIAGWISATLLYASTTAGCYLLLTGGFAATPFGVRGLGHLFAYLAVTAVACLGYGAVFLAIGLFLRNPVVPALAIFAWEFANPFLPALLKKISVIFYLNSMLPVHVAEGPLAVLAPPVSPWLGVPGLMLFTAAVLFLSGRRIRRMEVSYGTD